MKLHTKHERSASYLQERLARKQQKILDSLKPVDIKFPFQPTLQSPSSIIPPQITSSPSGPELEMDATSSDYLDPKQTPQANLLDPVASEPLSYDPKKTPRADSLDTVDSSTSEDDTRLIDDYVNASFVQPLCTRKRYIATQGPLEATFNDFWT